MLSTFKNTALAYLLILSGVFLVACQQQEQNSLTGYIEGDYTYLSAASSGFVSEAPVSRGQAVIAGQPLFKVDTAPEDEGLAQANAQVDAAKNQVKNLQAAKRETEIAALMANLTSAKAALQLAEIEYKRQSSLLSQKFVSASVVDAAKSNRDQAKATVSALQAQIATYRSPIGRTGEVGAATANVSSAESVVRQKAWLVAHQSATAPQNGLVSEVFYQSGEWVNAGSPVVRFLADNKRLIRFYIPEALRTKYQTGQVISVTCDGCGQPISATVRFISASAEYTPPVIYSEQSRSRLVFRAEATISGNPAALPLGLPVSIKAANHE